MQNLKKREEERGTSLFMKIRKWKSETIYVEIRSKFENEIKQLKKNAKLKLKYPNFKN